MAVQPNITQSKAQLTQSRVDREDHLILLLPASITQGQWPEIPYQSVLQQRLGRLPQPKCQRPLLTTDLPNERSTRVVLACLDETAETFELLTLGRKLTAEMGKTNPASVTVACAGLDNPLAVRGAEAVVAALLAGRAEMPHYHKQPPPKRRLKKIQLLGVARRLDSDRLLAEDEGNALARYLAAMPANKLTPAAYRKRIQRLARDEGWRMTFLDMDELKRKGAGAFLAVTQGSPTRDAGIVHLRYRPQGTSAKTKPRLALVGKGICFDTGGYSLKPSRLMQGMQADMEGSAVALGTFLTLSRLGVDFPMDCWLALAENHIGPKAYKPTDVVKAVNGTTIEVMNTDAEGRMVLADTLALASREKPGLILDFATLTGSCKVALSTRYTGAFTNRRELTGTLLEAGRASGERVWPLPSDADYDADLESEVADTKQCPLGGEADHTYAARFLGRFVGEKIQWIHLDLSAGKHKGGLAHVPTEMTGFGVRFALNLLLDHQAELAEAESE